MSPNRTSTKLTEQQLGLFRRAGILGPFDLLTIKEAKRFKRRIRRESRRSGPDNDNNGFRHLDCPSVWELCARDEIVERIAQLLGDDLILWRTHLFWKHRREREIPWHQDASNWPIQPGNTITAWIALDDANKRNGCMEMLPGQNSRQIEQHQSPGFERFRYQIDLEQIDVTRSEYVEVRAGQFVIFDDLIPHRSGLNRTWHDRLAIAMRVTQPSVPIDSQQLFPDYEVLLLRGTHEQGVNPLGRAPSASTSTQPRVKWPLAHR